MKQSLENQNQIMCLGPGETEERHAKWTELGLGGYDSRWAERSGRHYREPLAKQANRAHKCVQQWTQWTLLVSANGAPRHTDSVT